jgi:hypothetical protein
MKMSQDQTKMKMKKGRISLHPKTKLGGGTVLKLKKKIRLGSPTQKMFGQPIKADVSKENYSMSENMQKVRGYSIRLFPFKNSLIRLKKRLKQVVIMKSF